MAAPFGAAFFLWAFGHKMNTVIAFWRGMSLTDILTLGISCMALVLSALSFSRNKNIKNDDILMESCRALLDHAY